MKKVLILLTAVCSLGSFLSTPTYAQDNGSGFYSQTYSERNSGSFVRNSHLISLSYSVPNITINGTSWEGNIGPVYAKYEYGIIDEIGVGAYFAYANARFKTAAYEDHINSIGGGLMGFYHFNKFIPVSKLDVYVGLGVGFTKTYAKFDSGSPRQSNPSLASSDFVWGGVFKAGVRWYFTPAFGICLEGGQDGMSYANFGVSVRF